MHHTEYDREVGDGVRMRAEFDREHGRILKFMVQLEVEVAGHWRSVVRYDTAHGFAHKDQYKADGTVDRHQHMSVVDFNEGLTVAVRLIRKHGVEWAKEFLEEYP